MSLPLGGRDHFVTLRRASYVVDPFEVRLLRRRRRLATHHLTIEFGQRDDGIAQAVDDELPPIAAQPPNLGGDPRIAGQHLQFCFGNDHFVTLGRRWPERYPVGAAPRSPETGAPSPDTR